MATSRPLPTSQKGVGHLAGGVKEQGHLCRPSLVLPRLAPQPSQQGAVSLTGSPGGGHQSPRHLRVLTCQWGPQPFPT